MTIIKSKKFSSDIDISKEWLDDSSIEDKVKDELMRASNEELDYDLIIKQLKPTYGISSLYSGIKIETNRFMVDQKEVNRTWKERLFTKPWHPFRKTKTIYVPSKSYYFSEQLMTIFCHPEMKDEILKSIEERNKNGNNRY